MRLLNEFYGHLKPCERPSVGAVLRKAARRAFHQFKEFAGMFFYLWVLFALFAIYKSIVLIEYPLNYPSQSLAFANAFVLAKVMLVAEDFHFGTRFHGRSLAYSIVYKAFIFTLILICFYVIEHLVFGVWHGLSVDESFPRFGGKGLEPIVAIALIMFVVLTPFCAFREIGRVVGRDALRSLLFNREALAYRLEPVRSGSAPTERSARRALQSREAPSGVPEGEP
jgi:hypothetical protein